MNNNLYGTEFLYIKKSFNGVEFYSPIINKHTLIDRMLWSKTTDSPRNGLIKGKTNVNCEWFLENNNIYENKTEQMPYIGYILTKRGLKNLKILISNNK